MLLQGAWVKIYFTDHHIIEIISPVNLDDNNYIREEKKLPKKISSTVIIIFR